MQEWWVGGWRARKLLNTEASADHTPLRKGLKVELERLFIHVATPFYRWEK